MGTRLHLRGRQLVHSDEFIVVHHISTPEDPSIGPSIGHPSPGEIKKYYKLQINPRYDVFPI